MISKDVQHETKTFNTEWRASARRVATQCPLAGRGPAGTDDGLRIGWAQFIAWAAGERRTNGRCAAEHDASGIGPGFGIVTIGSATSPSHVIAEYVVERECPIGQCSIGKWFVIGWHIQQSSDCQFNGSQCGQSSDATATDQ